MNDKRFDIKETVNRNIQRFQYPSFSNHKSLIGWCTVNYPSIILNPIHHKKVFPQERQFDLDHLFQKKPIRTRDEDILHKPFSNINQQKIEGFIPSSYTLATTKHQIKAEIFQKQNINAQQFSSIKPLSCIIGLDRQKQLNKKPKQTQVNYIPPYENQQIRHLKKLPNTILNQQNLFDIAGSKLQYLDLQNNTGISIELISNLGYLSPNLKVLNINSIQITDEILIRLSQKLLNLNSINISKCKILTQFGVKTFLQKNLKLIKFIADHNPLSINNQSIKPLKFHKQLKSLSLNFCTNLSSEVLQNLPQTFQQISFNGLNLIKSEFFNKLIQSSSQNLVNVDLSYNPIEVTNSLGIKLSYCDKLQNLSLSGCQSLTDQFIYNLTCSQKGKNRVNQGFQRLKTLKLNSISNLGQTCLILFIKKCPQLNILEINNLQKLSDGFIQQIKSQQSLRRLLLNFTPNISDNKLQQLLNTNKKLKIHRNIIKTTDSSDNGLRMPVPKNKKQKKQSIIKKKMK